MNRLSLHIQGRNSVKLDSREIGRLVLEGNEACQLPAFQAKVETDQGIILFLSKQF